MGSVTFSQEMKALEDEIKTALAWAKDVNGITDPKQLSAYEAGLRQGWRFARGFFKVHGVVENLSFTKKM